MIATTESVDFVEELRLRRWALENYCYAEARQADWHPIVHDEMRRRDEEALSSDDISVLAEYEEPDSPGDSTILTDLPDTEDRVGITPAASARNPLPLGPIVPLAPDVPGLHGPHEITPPHTRTTEPAEMPELYFG